MGKTASLANIGSIADSSLGFRNRIINGAMVIDQRNAGTSVTPTNGQYLVDRFYYGASQASKFTAQQTPSATETGFATRVAAGFTNYLAFTVASAVTVGASDLFFFSQPIEGLNVTDLAWGTANAKTVTLSFLAYSSLTGTFGGALTNSAANRSYPFSYTISTANTWEQKSITIAGDQSGTWLTTNGVGIYLRVGLGAGSTYTAASGAWGAGNIIQPNSTVSVVGTGSATFYITGVQLEKGSTATSFDYRPYGTELALCQRYYQQIIKGTGQLLGTASYFSAARADGVSFLPVPMRTTPAFTVVTGTAYYRIYIGGNSSSCTTVSFNQTNNLNNIVLYFNNTDFGALTNGAGWWESQNASASIALTAEL